MKRSEAETMLDTLRRAPVLSREWHRAWEAIVDALCGAAPTTGGAATDAVKLMTFLHQPVSAQSEEAIREVIDAANRMLKSAPASPGEGPDVEKWIAIGGPGDVRHGLAASSGESAAPRCEGCGNEIDPDCCGCGDSRERHCDEAHMFIPAGCDCFRAGRADTNEGQHG